MILNTGYTCMCMCFVSAYNNCDQWHAWTSCSKTCGDGSHSRRRTCRLSALEQRDWTVMTDDNTTELIMDLEINEYEHAHCEDKACGGSYFQLQCTF